jgi:hypothetical protein
MRFSRIMIYKGYEASYLVLPENIFFYLVCEAIGTAATPGLLWQPRAIVKMIVEKQMECRLAGKTEVLGENLPQPHFCPSQNPTCPDPGLNPGGRGGKPDTNRLSYGAALPENKIMSAIKYLGVHFYFVLSFRYNFRKIFVSGGHMNFWHHPNEI